MSDTAHLRGPKPLTDEAELWEATESLLAVHKLSPNSLNLGQYKSEHSCQCGFVFVVDGHNPGEAGIQSRMDAHVTGNLLQLYQSHTRQLEQRVLEAKPRSNFSVDDSGLDRDLTEYERGWNDALDDYSTRLKGVFNQTKGSDES